MRIKNNLASLVVASTLIGGVEANAHNDARYISEATHNLNSYQEIDNNNYFSNSSILGLERIKFGKKEGIIFGCGFLGLACFVVYGISKVGKIDTSNDSEQ